MRRHFLAAAATGAVALAVLGLRANPALAQSGGTDPRWQAWIGCWEQAGAPGPAAVPGTGLVCVIPAEGRSAVEIVGVANGEITSREHIDATGERRETVRNGCSGWEQAEWSEDGRRVYLRAAHVCPNGAARNASGLLAFSPSGVWLDVQSVAVGAYPGVRVARYREATNAAPLPDEVARAIAGRSPDHWALRAAAGGSIGAAEVIEAIGHLEAIAVESWLVELGAGFDLNADRLLGLADQGVPDRVIDLMIALSYPGVFSVSAATSGGGARIEDAEQAAPSPNTSGGGYGSTGYYDDRRYSPFGWDPYAYGYGGYGYGGWYWGNRPIIIVVGPGTGGGTGGGSGRHGQVVKGQGYTGGDNTGPRARPNPGTGSTGSGSVSSGGYAQPHSTGSGSTGSGSSGTSSPSSGSSTSTGRTAHPRP